MCRRPRATDIEGRKSTKAGTGVSSRGTKLKGKVNLAKQAAVNAATKSLKAALRGAGAAGRASKAGAKAIAKKFAARSKANAKARNITKVANAKAKAIKTVASAKKKAMTDHAYAKAALKAAMKKAGAKGFKSPKAQTRAVTREFRTAKYTSAATSGQRLTRGEMSAINRILNGA